MTDKQGERLREIAGYHDTAPICNDCKHYRCGGGVRDNHCKLLDLVVNVYGTCSHNKPKKV